MDKKPRRMDFAEYTMEVQHTHTWYYPDEVLPPSNENVIVETKETLSYQCAFYIDENDMDCIPENAIFIDQKGMMDTKHFGIQKGFYTERPQNGPYPVYKAVSVIRWTDCPSMGIGAEHINILHALRRYFGQEGRSIETRNKVITMLRLAYEENPVNWEELENDKS